MAQNEPRPPLIREAPQHEDMQTAHTEVEISAWHVIEVPPPCHLQRVARRTYVHVHYIRGVLILTPDGIPLFGPEYRTIFQLRSAQDNDPEISISGSHNEFPIGCITKIPEEMLHSDTLR